MLDNLFRKLFQRSDKAVKVHLDVSHTAAGWTGAMTISGQEYILAGTDGELESIIADAIVTAAKEA